MRVFIDESPNTYQVLDQQGGNLIVEVPQNKVYDLNQIVSGQREVNRRMDCELGYYQVSKKRLNQLIEKYN